jgi:isocitrate dehydrogenase
VALFEATHGSAPKYANLDKVNPGSLLFSGVNMLEYIGWKEAADLISTAYPEVVKKKIVTYDFARQMQGSIEVSTSGFADALIRTIEGGIDVESLRAQYEKDFAGKVREAREALRQSPTAELESGRTPHTVGDIMSTTLFTVKPDVTVEEAMHELNQRNISGVLVEPDSQGQWGMFTQNDVVTKVILSNHSPTNMKVNEVATRPLKMVTVDTSLHECVTLMSQLNIRRIVVEKGKQPIGIVTYTDIMRTVEKFGWVPIDL